MPVVGGFPCAFSATAAIAAPPASFVTGVGSTGFGTFAAFAVLAALDAFGAFGGLGVRTEFPCRLIRACTEDTCPERMMRTTWCPQLTHVGLDSGEGTRSPSALYTTNSCPEPSLWCSMSYACSQP